MSSACFLQDHLFKADPLSLLVRTNLAVMLHYSRRYDEAIAQYQKNREWRDGRSGCELQQTVHLVLVFRMPRNNPI
jgi:hypothetical protein